MFRLLHSNRTTAAKKTDLTRLKCIQFGPIEGCCCLIVILFREWTIINLRRGENLHKLTEEGKIELGNFCWYLNPEDSKAFLILLDSLHNNSVPREHSHFPFWTCLKDNNKRLKPNVSWHHRYRTFKILTYSENIQEIRCLVDVLLAKTFQSEKRIMSFWLQMALCVL